MNALRKLDAIEQALREAFTKRFPYLDPRFLLTSSQALANQRSVKLAAVLMPYVYLEDQVRHWRHGARWILHVSDIKRFDLQTRSALITVILDEMEQYIEKGYISREETSSHVFDDAVYRLQRAGNRTIN